jgi:CHAT domain-containing protein
VLKHGRIRITKAMTPTEQEREEQLERQLVLLNSRISAQKSAVKAEPAALAELDATLKKSRLEYDAFHMELYAAHPELKAQRGEIEISPATVESASSMLLSSDVALLEYEMGEQESYLFALTSKGAADEKELKTYRIAIASKELRQKAERFREQLAQRNLDFRKSSRDLYKLLLQPAKAQLAGRHTLILIPDGPLWNLPFQALIAENNRYLLEDYAIGYAPSLTVLREMIRSRERNNGVATSLALLAMGNPAIGKATSDRLQVAFRDEKLEPLPDAETEVKTLGQLYGGKSEVYVGAQAREDRFKAEAGKAAILHLATHGFLSDSNPMYSHLVLSADEKGTEDGLLETREIMDLDLKADLAVLSACESGRGKVGAGEGLIGLSWAFFIAGVPTTVASQWKVESESTTKLMLAFHRSLKQEHGSALATARSLQAAALKLLHDPQYAHPFYWAGFVVVGNPN